eukprot:scaffold12824_cov26-Tisochrysis_lutea.AAC.3
MHVLMSSGVPAAALFTNSGSASSGRAMETRSALPEARIASATSGVLMRFVATRGRDTDGLSFSVTQLRRMGMGRDGEQQSKAG